MGMEGGGMISTCRSGLANRPFVKQDALLLKRRALLQEQLD